jgi:hypothetical protein
MVWTGAANASGARDAAAIAAPVLMKFRLSTDLSPQLAVGAPYQQASPSQALAESVVAGTMRALRGDFGQRLCDLPPHATTNL